MSVSMPAAVVLIVCKTVVAGPEDPNAKWTGAENLDWATEHNMMICKRQEVSMYDQAAAMGAAAQPFNRQRCQASGLVLGVNWNQANKSSKYRFWRVACPTPIIGRNKNGHWDIIAWKMPECGNRDTVICEVDSEI